VSFVGIVIASLSSSMVIGGVGIIGIGEVVVIALSSSSMGIISVGIIVVGRVGSALGLGVVSSVVVMQHAGESLHDGEMSAW